MCDKRLLTVIVPVYNVREFLKPCIESILNQTYRNLEVILVDDGSTDGSENICDDYAKTDQRIKVLHKKNGGLVSARQEGLKNANGYYTAFVDGDDWIDLDMYEYLISEMKKSEAEVATSGFYKECGESVSVVHDELDAGVYDGNSEILSSSMLCGKVAEEAGIIPNIWNKLFLTNQVKEYYLCINENISYGEDAACVYALLPYAKKVRIIHRAFYHYRFRNSSLMHIENEKILYEIGLLYVHLLHAFRGHEKYAKLKKQLSVFITANIMRALNYHIGFEDDVKIPFYLLPDAVYGFGEKIVIYGAGMVGGEYERQLKSSEKGVLVKWVDKMADQYRKNGKDVHPVEEIVLCEYDVVLIAISDENTAGKIKKDLMELGVPECKIYWEMPKTIFGRYMNLE